MSRRTQYPVASTSYHAPPDDTHRQLAGPAARSRMPHSISQDIYIPTSQEERNRVGIESRLLQAGGPRYRASIGDDSTLDTYDRIGLDEHEKPMAGHPDESMIPGVGRGIRNENARQASHYEQLRSLKQYTSHMTNSSPVRSPYRPGKYRNGYAANSTVRPSLYRTSSAAPLDLDAVTATLRSRHARVETETDTDNDSGSESADSDVNGHEFGSVQSTGNHQGFAATPAGHTMTVTHNIRQRPQLGPDTLNRIDFDLNTDTDSEKRSRNRPLQRSNSDDPTYTNIKMPPRAAQTRRQDVQHDPTGPFAHPRAANTFNMNAANYQQHLSSRTLTSPALRTMIGDRSKSPDSPTPATSVDNINRASRAQRDSSAVSAFEDLARRLQRDVELTRRGGVQANEEAEDGSNSNSGGSGFGPGSQASSARTKVDALPPATTYNKHGYPAYNKATTMQSPFVARLPDITGLTSALGSPIKTRDGHRGFDPAVGNQEARIQELANLRSFVEGIQVELDRAGERILSLEETQDLQGQEVQGLRADMQNIMRGVREQNHVSDSQLVEIATQRLQQQQQQQEKQSSAAKQKISIPITSKSHQPAPVGPAIIDETVQQESHARDQAANKQHVNAKAINKLYTELDQLRFAMEEQYKSAAATKDSVRSSQRTNGPDAGRSSDRDPWEAIEALRIQVLQLASQVEGLSSLVHDELVVPQQQQAQTRFTSVRKHTQHQQSQFDGHAASDPVLPYREDMHARPFTSSRAHNDARSNRRTLSQGPPSAGRHATVEDYLEDRDDHDRTIDAVAENRNSQRNEQGRHVEEMDEHDISRTADFRAERASARILTSRPEQQRGQHVASTCSVCANRAKSDRRKAARKTKMLKAEQRREAVELEEATLLHAIDPQQNDGDSTLVLGRAEIKTLSRILAEHWDEFLHQRMLYSELADELKSLSPEMSKTKRRILAHHVLEAVELLELKADRINRLDKVLAAYNTQDYNSAPKVRKEAGKIR